MLDAAVLLANEKLWLWITQNHDQECYFAGVRR
jgi:hypothetical protein